VVFDAVYDEFRDRLVAATERLKLGPNDSDDFGPVINAEQLEHMLGAVQAAQMQGATILTGGYRLDDETHQGGYYMAPTLLEAARPDDPISTEELFGPIAALYRTANFEQALELANRSPYGLTAAIHTRSLHRAWQFAQKVQAGVASVNAGTFGSEPHMPFGGRKQSGNGSREPGTEALDIYSELKDIYLNIDPAQL
jgi:aldehyde dehydrogenase (NAD+)